jgi:hypothetical protein
MHLQFEEPPRFGALPEGYTCEGAVLGMVLKRRNEEQIMGSAVMVAPGLAITAAHLVTDEDVSDFERAEMLIDCFGVAIDGVQGWRVKQLHRLPGTDLCTLSLEFIGRLPPSRRLLIVPLSTRTPAVGEKVVVAGFQAQEQRWLPKTEGVPGVLPSSFYMGSGVVTELQPEGRGRNRPWPSISVDCKSIGGMSGGPVFDSHGFVIGLISSSFADWPTFVAPIWQALCHPVPAGVWWKIIFGDDNPRSILELLIAARGAVVLERADAIEVQKIGKGMLIKYHSWT